MVAVAIVEAMVEVRMGEVVAVVATEEKSAEVIEVAWVALMAEVADTVVLWGVGESRAAPGTKAAMEGQAAGVAVA